MLYAVQSSSEGVMDRGLALQSALMFAFDFSMRRAHVPIHRVAGASVVVAPLHIFTYRGLVVADADRPLFTVQNTKEVFEKVIVAPMWTLLPTHGRLDIGQCYSVAAQMLERLVAACIELESGAIEEQIVGNGAPLCLRVQRSHTTLASPGALVQLIPNAPSMKKVTGQFPMLADVFWGIIEALYAPVP